MKPPLVLASLAPGDRKSGKEVHLVHLSIWRHSDSGTTLSYYVETPEAETCDALDQLSKLMQA